MALYESVIIGRQDLTNSQFETLIDEFTSVIKSHDGEIKKTIELFIFDKKFKSWLIVFNFSGKNP